ncbi:MAG: hypothetical protein IKD66_09300 [Solobacterium sp.]|nr:hypothetical protein [Solobacterium sp.]
MARLSDKERESIKMQITEENVMLMRVKRYVQYGGVIFVASLAMLVTFFRNSTGAPRIITIIIAVISGLFTLFSYLSYRNGRKHILKNINYLDENK